MMRLIVPAVGDFPSFWEGLSLRRLAGMLIQPLSGRFPFLLGGTFIEAI